MKVSITNECEESQHALTKTTKRSLTSYFILLILGVPLYLCINYVKNKIIECSIRKSSNKKTPWNKFGMILNQFSLISSNIKQEDDNLI